MKMKVTENFPVNKMVFFILNIFLMLVAASYLGIGSWLVVTYKTEKESLYLIQEYYNTMGILMLVVGGITCLLAFLGFALIFVRKVSVFVAYIVIWSLIFLLGIAIGIVGFVYASNVDPRIKDTIVENTFLAEDFEAIQLVDAIQQDFKCCGLNGPHDWVNWISKGTVPLSCCDSGLEICNQDNQYKDGCLNKVRNSIFNDMVLSGAISIAIILPTVLGMVSAGSQIIELMEKSAIKYRTSKA